MPPSPESELPDRIGRYRILRLLGKGGMGSVYEAEQDNPRRRVALKVVQTGIANEEIRRRFELEAHVLGHLHHPCIAQIFEAGLHEGAGSSQPFFAMELIAGLPLDRYVCEQGLDTHARLELVARICDGIQHAHQRGVIHRDLKPDNILVDASGQPKILDFGLARATDADLQAATLHTDVGQVMGTVPYMSPEQAAGDPAALDLRTDIYSLGVVGYRLLSGEMPYAVLGVPLFEALRVVREEEARPLGAIQRSLGGDIGTIFAKALEKDPERRYPSASGLAEDIRHYLAHEPISARPPSTLYQLGKFTRRHKALVLGVSAVFVALLAGLIGTGFGLVRASAEAERATKTATFFQSILGGVDPALAQGTDTELLQRILDATAARISVELADLPRIEATIRETMMIAYGAIGSYPAALAQARRLEQLHADEFGPDASETLVTRRNAGHFLSRMGDHAGAEESLRSALADCEEALGSEHRETQIVRAVLGRLYIDMQRTDDAAAIHERTLPFLRRELGLENTWTLNTLAGMGLVRIQQRRFGEAEELLRDVLAVRRRLHGEASPQAIDATHNLAGVFYEQDRFEEAEALYLETIALCDRILGPDHAMTLLTRQTYASLLVRVARYAEAEALYLELLKRNRAEHGVEDPFTYRLESQLANAYRLWARHAEVLPLATHASEGFAVQHGPDHHLTLQARSDLLFSLMALGRTEEARPLLVELSEAYRRVHGEEHPHRLRFLSDFVAQEIAARRFAEAESLAREVLEVRRRMLGDDDRETLHSVGGMALIEHGLDRPGAAIALFAEYIRGWARLFGDADPTIENATRLMLQDLDRVAAAGPFEAAIRELLELHERSGAEDSERAVHVRVLLGEALVDAGRPAESLEPLERVLEHGERAGTPSPRAFAAYGAALMELERRDEALGMLQIAWDEARDAALRARIAARLAELHELLADADEAAAWRGRATR